MRIGILADTHIPRRARRLPDFVIDQFRGVDEILHAGDIVDESVLETLAQLAPVTAVPGNNDSSALWRRLPERRILERRGYRIGLIHGHGSAGRTPWRAYTSFAADHLDCIVFGHSHMPMCLWQGKTLLLNPGSPTDRRRSPHFSIAFLELGERLTPRLIFFDDAGRIVGDRHADCQPPEKEEPPR